MSNAPGGLRLCVRDSDVIWIGDDIKIHAEKCGKGIVRVTIRAPKDLKIRGPRQQSEKPCSTP